MMVGEIRDLETAQIAIQASLTGHLVFSTLHTNDAAGAVTRLIDMDVEPYLISSTLEAVLGQRLVRTICEHCKTAYEPDDGDAGAAGPDRRRTSADREFYYGAGCSYCNDTGYHGRKGIYEYLPITEPIRELINERKPTLVIREQGHRAGHAHAARGRHPQHPGRLHDGGRSPEVHVRLASARASDCTHPRSG